MREAFVGSHTEDDVRITEADATVASAGGPRSARDIEAFMAAAKDAERTSTSQRPRRQKTRPTK
jgi:hypothetical protein